MVDVRRKPIRRTEKAVSACFLLAVFLSIAAGRATGDFVVLKNGKRLAGLVRGETQQWVRIETVGGVLTLDRKSIDHVEVQPTAENLFLSGRIALRKPDFLEAADLLKRSLDAGAEPARIRRMIIETSPYFLDRLIYLSSIARKKWFAFCDELSREGAQDRDWAFLRGQMALATGDGAGALSAWRSLDSSFFSSHPKERNLVIKWVLRRLSRVVADHRLEESVGLLELLNALDPERARSCRVVLLMQRAALARDRGSVDEACRIYGEELMPLAPEIAKVCLRTTVERHCERLFERGAYKQAAGFLRRAALAYLPEDVTRPLLAKAYRGEIEAYLSEGKWDMARGLLVEATPYLDAGEVESIREKCYYGEQRDKIGPDDYAGHYKLGLELEKKKMNGAAIEEFIIASQSPQLRELAQKQIAVIRESEALALMEKIVGLYDSGKYIEALDLIDKFRARFPKSDILSQVNSISKLAHEKARDQAKKEILLASTRVEHARRLAILGKLQQALELLDGVLNEDPQAPAAKEAMALKQEILRSKLAEKVGSAPDRKPRTVSPDAASLLPDIDPDLIDQLNEDAFKAEIEQILKQLQL